jgi:CheY-like chemotaxis protein
VSGVGSSEIRILLVEDEPTTREILTELLRREGYEIDSVASVGAGTTCLQSIRYALVISDWLLPDGSGIDVADLAAQQGSKTLILSDYLFQLPGGAAERHELLTKRLDPAMIVATVRRIIGKPGNMIWSATCRSSGPAGAKSTELAPKRRGATDQPINFLAGIIKRASHARSYKTRPSRGAARVSDMGWLEIAAIVSIPGVLLLTIMVMAGWFDNNQPPPDK